MFLVCWRFWLPPCMHAVQPISEPSGRGEESSDAWGALTFARTSQQKKGAMSPENGSPASSRRQSFLFESQLHSHWRETICKDTGVHSHDDPFLVWSFSEGSRCRVFVSRVFPMIRVLDRGNTTAGQFLLLSIPSQDAPASEMLVNVLRTSNGSYSSAHLLKVQLRYSHEEVGLHG